MFECLNIETWIRVICACHHRAVRALIARYGPAAAGMPPPWVYEGSDGALLLYNGVTRATRIAKLSPGTLITVEVIGKLPKAFAADPLLGT